MIRILVVHHSQTGQLTRIARSFLSPLDGRPDVQIDWHQVDAVPPYPFPWPLLDFFDAFPESIHGDPPTVAQPTIPDNTDYDLVVLAWQVWFLSPSLPITGFLASPERHILKNRRVISIIACRNMWTMAWRTMSARLHDAGAMVVDNVVLTDTGPLWSTFITTPWWLLSGKQESPVAWLPRAGVSEADIRGAARFGHALVDSLPAIRSGSHGPFLGGLAAVAVDRHTMLAERIGARSFQIWGALVRRVGKPRDAARKPILIVYIVFLTLMILTVLPVSMLVTAILARFSSRVTQQAKDLEAPSGSGRERLSHFRVADPPLGSGQHELGRPPVC